MGTEGGYWGEDEQEEISQREFEAFYMAHWRRLVAALASSLPSQEDPADVAQEAFARAYANWKSVGSHERPGAWLCLTAFRLASSVRRRLRAKRRTEAQFLSNSR
jgi:RNA polymerase sigma-70 factor, ECF subfamily